VRFFGAKFVNLVCCQREAVLAPSADPHRLHWAIAGQVSSTPPGVLSDAGSLPTATAKGGVFGTVETSGLLPAASVVVSRSVLRLVFVYGRHDRRVVRICLDSNDADDLLALLTPIVDDNAVVGWLVG
jgi:hypothetical protein